MIKSKIKCLFVFMLTFMLLIIPVYAMEPTSNGIYISNDNPSDITICVAHDGQTENHVIKASDKIHLEYAFDEPGIYNYEISQLNKEDSVVYVVQFYVESDDAGHLTSVVVPFIKGEKEKPIELKFGEKSEPETERETPSETIPEESRASGDVETGDSYSIVIMGLILICSVLAIILLCIKLKKTRKNE